MKLSKDKIIEAAEAFNQAESFDEFKILLDLINVTLEDFICMTIMKYTK